MIHFQNHHKSKEHQTKRKSEKKNKENKVPFRKPMYLVGALCYRAICDIWMQRIIIYSKR